MPDASLPQCRIGHSLRRLVLASLFWLAINNRDGLRQMITESSTPNSRITGNPE
jgi:hypothetical protein